MSRHLTTLAVALVALVVRLSVVAPVTCDAALTPHAVAATAPAPDPETHGVSATSPRLAWRVSVRPLRTPSPAAPAIAGRSVLGTVGASSPPHTANGRRLPLYVELRVLRSGGQVGRTVNDLGVAVIQGAADHLAGPLGRLAAMRRGKKERSTELDGVALPLCSHPQNDVVRRDD